MAIITIDLATATHAILELCRDAINSRINQMLCKDEPHQDKNLFTPNELNESKGLIEDTLEDDPAVVFKSQRPGSEETQTLDSAGNPWDKNIHSSSRARNNDGTWRLLRNVKKSNDEERINIKDEAPIKTALNRNVETSVCTFDDLMALVTQGLQTNALSVTRTTQLINTLGVKTLLDLSKQPQLIPAAMNLISAELATEK